MRIKQLLNLSLSLAIAEFKLRNEGSYLGILWYLLNPILTFILLLAVFSTRLGQNIPDYPLYLLLGIIMFNFFNQIASEATRTIRDHAQIIKSINFPKESLSSSIVLKALFSHIFEIIILILFLVFFGISIQGMIFYPIILGAFLAFTVGMALIFSSLTVYFRDFEYIWVFASRLLWLATPIFYSVEGQSKLFVFNLFNPLYYFITVARDLIVYSKVPHLWMIGGAIGFTLLCLFTGLFIFDRLKGKMAEML